MVFVEIHDTTTPPQEKTFLPPAEVYQREEGKNSIDRFILKYISFQKDQRKRLNRFYKIFANIRKIIFNKMFSNFL